MNDMFRDELSRSPRLTFPEGGPWPISHRRTVRISLSLGSVAHFCLSLTHPATDFFGFFGAQKKDFFWVHAKKGAPGEWRRAGVESETLRISAFTNTLASGAFFGVHAKKVRPPPHGGARQNIRGSLPVQKTFQQSLNKAQSHLRELNQPK